MFGFGILIQAYLAKTLKSLCVLLDPAIEAESRSVVRCECAAGNHRLPATPVTDLGLKEFCVSIGLFTFHPFKSHRREASSQDDDLAFSLNDPTGNGGSKPAD